MPTPTPPNSNVPPRDIQCAIDAGYSLAIAKLALKSVTLGEIPAVLVPKELNVLFTEGTLSAPARKRGIVTLLSIDSFIRFFNEHKNDMSRIFTKDGRFVGVVDYHSAQEGARWGHFRAQFNSNFSEQWKLWNSKDGSWFQQRQFAEFIEENVDDVVSPSPAEMLEISRTLEAKRDVVFKQATRLDNGDSSLRYEETTNSKAGANGELEIPKIIKLSIPIFFGMPAEGVHLRFKFTIENGHLALKYEIIRKAELLQVSAQTLVERVNKECATLCYAAEEPAPQQPFSA